MSSADGVARAMSNGKNNSTLCILNSSFYFTSSCVNIAIQVFIPST
jgi:hypothetical protein